MSDSRHRQKSGTPGQGLDPDLMVALNRALRGAVSDQLHSFLDKVFPPLLDGYDEGDGRDIRSEAGGAYSPPRCAKTGAVILSRQECVVTHAPPDTLAVLRDKWLASEGITAAEVQLTGGGDWMDQGPLRLLNPSLVSSWRAFHQDRAVLTIVSRAEVREVQNRR